MKRLVFILILLLSSWCNGVTYYLNTASTGTGDGTTIATTGDHAAWKAISEITGLSAGDFVYFNKGDTWREQLTVPASGSAGSPITFGAYGDGDDPIINGADLVTTWSQYLATDIYSASCDWTATQVFEDDTRLTFVTWDTDIATTAAAMNAGTWTLDTDNDFVYVWATDDADPDTHTMELSKRSYCIYLRGTDADNTYDYITLENLNLKNSNSMGCLIKYANNAIVDTVKSEFNYNVSFYVGAADDVILKYCIGSNSASSHGFYLDGAEENGTDRPIVEHSSSYNNYHCGIQINGNGVYQVTNPIIRYNQMYDNTTDGLLDMSSSDGIYCYNLIWGNYNKGLSLSYDPAEDATHQVPSSGAKVYNNTIIVESGDSWGVFISGYSENSLIKNNIIHFSGTEQIIRVTSTAVSTTIDENCYYSTDYTSAFYWVSSWYSTFAAWQAASSQDAHSIAADPLFVDAAGGDFRLQSSSPCINAGIDVCLTNDYSGNQLGKVPDIGAYEISIDFPGERDRYIYGYREVYRNRFR